MGAPLYINGQADEGLFSLFYGNRHVTGFDIPGVDLVPFMRRTDGATPISLLGKSDSQDTFQFGVFGRSPLGRHQVRIDWDLQTLGGTWDSTRTWPEWENFGPSAGAGVGSRVVFQGVITYLDPETVYHWRVRTRTRSPFYPRSPWMPLPGNAANETDMRTAAAPGGITATADRTTDLQFQSISPNPATGPAAIRFAMPAAVGEDPMPAHAVRTRERHQRRQAAEKAARIEDQAGMLTGMRPGAAQRVHHLSIRPSRQAFL